MNDHDNRIASAIRWIILITIWSVPLVFCAWLHYPYLLPKLALYRAAIALCLFLWSIEIAVKKEVLFLKSATTLAVMAFLAISAISVFFAVNLHEAFNALAHIASGAALYLLLTGHVRERRFFVYLFNGVTIVGLAILAYAILQYKGFDIAALRGKTIGTTPTAGVSTLGNVNFVGEYFAIIINFSLFLFLGSITLAGDTAYALSTLMLFASLILARSRSGWISLTIAVTASILLMIRYMMGSRSRPYLRRVWRKLFVLFILAVIVFFMANRLMPFTDELTFELKTLFAGAPLKTNIQRIFIWQCTLNMILDYPVTGVGVGNFKIEYPRYRSLAEREIAGGRTRIERTHNDYLQIAAETGVFGLAAFLWVIVLSLHNSRKVLRSRTGSMWKATTVALTGGLIAILTNALFNFPLLNPSPSVYFWAIVGSLALLSTSGALNQNRIDPNVIRMALRNFAARAGLVMAGLAILCASLVNQGKDLISDYQLQRGREHYYFTRWREAVDSFTKALSYSPNNRITHHYLANTYNLLGEHERAVEEYGVTLTLHPNYEAAHYGLGSAFLAMKRFKEAAECYGNALELRQNYTLAYVHLGSTLEKLGRFREALEAYNRGAVVEERMLSEAPNNWNARYRRASLIESMGNVYMQTAKYKQAILRYNEAAQDMAYIYYGSGISHKVKDLLEFDLKVKKAYVEIYNALGAAYAGDGQIDKAIAIWHEVLKVDPNNEPARYNLQKAGSLKAGR